MKEVVLDKLPHGVNEATVQAWYLEEGDAVVRGDEIAELATEEGVQTVTAPASGILAEVYYDEGEVVERGEVLCLIETEGSSEEDEGDDSGKTEEE